MDDDEMEAMEEGVAKTDEDENLEEETEEVIEDDNPIENGEKPDDRENDEEAIISENPDESEIIEEDKEADEEIEGETEKENEDIVPENTVDEELEIRDEDNGRPVSSMSKKSVAFADPPFDDNQPKKEPGALAKMIRGMWASREMLNENTDKQIIMKTTLRELILYCIFLFVIVYMTFSQYSADFYVLRSRIDSLFENQQKITQAKDFWNFVESDLMDGLYWEELYNKGRKVTQFKCPSTGMLANDPCPVAYTDRNMMYENRMLGVPRMRQIKVTNSSCLEHMNSDFKSAIRKCFAPYAEEYEDKVSYIPEHRKFTEESAWVYQSAEELETGTVDGELGTYGGGGYVQNFHFQKNVTEALLQELKANRWIDRGTRFLTIDLTVYNANINLFGVIKLVFEFPATGGCIPSNDIQIVKLLKYAEYTDYMLLAAEGIFCLFIMYYIIEESFEIREHGFAYFTVFGNLLDIVVIGVSITQILLNFYMFYQVNDKLDGLMKLPFQYADFTNLSKSSKTFTYLAGFNVFVAWLKVFKYLSFNKTMTQLSGTLSKCSKELSGFTVMFLIIFFAFAQLGFLLFGTQVEDFNNFVSASYTLFRTILGDFNFVVIEQADSTFGPLYFLSYIFFVFFVLLNMFLAIINDTYGEVKADLKRAKPAFQLGDFFMVGVNNVKFAAGIQDRKLDVENALKMAAEDDGFVTYQELRENLKHSNFSDVEIDLFFDMFSEDPSMSEMLIDEDEAKERELEEERILQMQSMIDDSDSDDSDSDEEDDLAKSQASIKSRPMSGKEARQQRSAKIKAALAGNIPLEADKFYGLTERMGRMEATIGPILSKIDSVLDRLDDMKKSKKKKKDTMQRLMETIEDNEGLDETTKNQQIQDLVQRMDSRPNSGM